MRPVSRTWTALAVAAVLIVNVPGHAGPGKARKRKQARQMTLEQRLALAEKAVARAEALELRKARSFTHKHRADGDLVAQRVKQLEQLPWQSDLEQAYALAKKADKPVLWIHALGTVDGHL